MRPTPFLTAVGKLPHIDEHTIVVDAPVDEAWAALVAALDGAFAGRLAAAYARVVGCNPARSSGPRPLQGGSTVPGFAVTSAVSADELVLAGRHLFSTYELTFRLQPAADGRTVIRAESRATFPGAHGRLYRLCVLDTGFHVVAVRRLLASIRRRADVGTRPMSK